MLRELLLTLTKPSWKWKSVVLLLTILKRKYREVEALSKTVFFSTVSIAHLALDNGLQPMFREVLASTFANSWRETAFTAWSRWVTRKTSNLKTYYFCLVLLNDFMKSLRELCSLLDFVSISRGLYNSSKRQTAKKIGSLKREKNSISLKSLMTNLRKGSKKSEKTTISRLIVSTSKRSSR